MTDLANTALEFCRECLGWGQVRAFALRGNAFIEGLVVSEPINEYHRFQYTDLNAVMEAAASWFNKRGLFIHLHIGVGRYSVTTSTDGKDRGALAPSFQTACEALLTACVEAARKLKAEAA